MAMWADPLRQNRRGGAAASNRADVAAGVRGVRGGPSVAQEIPRSRISSDNLGAGRGTRDAARGS
jgi:hypothetical protein